MEEYTEQYFGWDVVKGRKVSMLTIKDVHVLPSCVKISDTKFSGNHAASCTSSKPDSNLSKNSSISSAGFLQPTLE